MNRKEFNQKYLNINKEEFVLEDKISDIKKIKKNLKFYKYYDLTDEFTILNIENKIIHFSNPEKFNDPFDCSCSFDFDSFIKHHTITLLLSELEQDEIIYPLLKGYFYNDLNEELLTNVGNSCVKILNINFNQTLNENEFIVKFNNYLINYFSNLAEKYNIDQAMVIKKISEYNLQEGENILDFHENNFYYFIKFLVGDVFTEELKEMDSYINEKSNIFRNLLNDKIRVICFTEDYDNALMWAHYANKHNGICVEYDFSIINELLLKNLFPVEYRVDRPTITKDILDNPIKITKYILDSMSIKSDCWNYEKEWRIIMPINSLFGKDNYYTPKVSRVFFGVKVSDVDFNKFKNKILSVDGNIQCIKLKMHYKNYSLDEED